MNIFGKICTVSIIGGGVAIWTHSEKGLLIAVVGVVVSIGVAHIYFYGIREEREG